jgi:hypothetical protein
MRTFESDKLIIDDDWIDTPSGWYHLCVQKSPLETKYYVSGTLEHICINDWDL